MRTAKRLKGLKKFFYENLCKDREMKAPAENLNIGEIKRQEPQCHLAWAPARADKTGIVFEETMNVVPGIIIMPDRGHIKYMEEKRFDRYNNIHRPQALGQQLSISVLFSVYEPGIRLPGFIQSVGSGGKGLDTTLIKEGTEEGLFTLLDWMDDAVELLLGAKEIPETDLFLDEESGMTSLFKDQEYVVDRRPAYYGFLNCTFQCYATEKQNKEINQYLI